MPSKHNKLQLVQMVLDQELMGHLAKEAYNTGQTASQLTNHGS